MRIVLAVLALVVLAPVATAQPSPRAASVVNGLGVDERTAARLIDLISKYDEEVDALHIRRSELKRRLVTARNDEPKSVEKLLDEALANQRALLKADERLLGRVRGFLSPRITAQLLVLMSVTEPTHGSAQREQLERSSRRDPDALWPPRSANQPCDPFSTMHSCRPRCDPFASMHRC